MSISNSELDPESTDEDRREEMIENGEVAMYAGFWSRLDCQVCGGVTEVPDDVSNGEVINCEDCGVELVVQGR